MLNLPDSLKTKREESIFPKEDADLAIEALKKLFHRNENRLAFRLKMLELACETPHPAIKDALEYSLKALLC
jgi:hypothetical protein